MCNCEDIESEYSQKETNHYLQYEWVFVQNHVPVIENNYALMVIVVATIRIMQSTVQRQRTQRDSHSRR